MGEYKNLCVKANEGEAHMIPGMMDYHSVRDLKEAVGNQIGQDPDNVRLIWAGKELDEMATDEEGELCTLKDYDIVDDATIFMVI